MMSRTEFENTCSEQGLHPETLLPLTLVAPPHQPNNDKASFFSCSCLDLVSSWYNLRQRKHTISAKHIKAQGD